MKGFTQKQKDILDFIEEFMNEEGMAPTVYEIADKFKIKTSTVFAHIRALQKKNHLSRSSKARSIALTKAKRKLRHPVGLRAIPVYDDTKGRDTSVYTGLQKELYCDSSLFEKTLHSDCRSLFALRIHGGSMAAYGILDGDIAIVKKHPEKLKQGDIVLTGENGESALRSCVQIDVDCMKLMDSKGNTKIYPLKDLILQGIVVGLQRAM